MNNATRKNRIIQNLIKLFNHTHTLPERTHGSDRRLLTQRGRATDYLWTCVVRSSCSFSAFVHLCRILWPSLRYLSSFLLARIRI